MSGEPVETLNMLKELAAEAQLGRSAVVADVGMEVPVEGDELEAWAGYMKLLLFPEHQAEVDRVKAVGAGVSPKCKWS